MSTTGTPVQPKSAVPKFSGVTSWDRYRQEFDAIVRLNGWDDVTVALQLLSHLEGDTLNVALLLPEAQRAMRAGLVMALTEHYGSPGQLADYQIIAIDLDTLAVKAFEDMGPNARLPLIQDRIIAGHENCALRRHLDSVLLEKPIWDIVDRCRVWESHANTDARRIVKPTPERAQPVYTVNKPA